MINDQNIAFFVLTRQIFYHVFFKPDNRDDFFVEIYKSKQMCLLFLKLKIFWITASYILSLIFSSM